MNFHLGVGFKIAGEQDTKQGTVAFAATKKILGLKSQGASLQTRLTRC